MKLGLRSRRRPLGPDVHHLLAQAAEEARGLQHGFVGTEHVLLACLIDVDDSPARALLDLGVTATDVRAAIVETVGLGSAAAAPPIDPVALATIGIDFDDVRRAIEDRFGPGAIERTSAGRPRLTRRVEKALEAARSADGFFVSNEDVLLAILHDHDSLAARILARRGLDVCDLEVRLARARGKAA